VMGHMRPLISRRQVIGGTAVATLYDSQNSVSTLPQDVHSRLADPQAMDISSGCFVSKGKTRLKACTRDFLIKACTITQIMLTLQDLEKSRTVLDLHRCSMYLQVPELYQAPCRLN